MTEAPERLIKALKDSSRREIFVPPYVDRAVLEAARRHLAKESSASRRRPWWMLWPALATACLATALIARFLTAHSQPQFAREDLNHDGRVDILDSFALARELKSGQVSPAAFDVNGDGVVDERDVAIIAAHAVALGKDDRS